MVHPTPLRDTLTGGLPGPALMPVGLTPCDRTALRRLKTAYGEGRPLAVMIGKGRSRSARVIEDFIGDLEPDVEVVRFTEPCADATSWMRDIVLRVGFEPKDFSLPDLESIFKMFLAYQKTHGRRTVICLEEAQGSCAWVLDKVAELVQAEAGDSMGLFVLLSGRPALAELFEQDPLQAIDRRLGRPIAVAALTPAETRGFVRQLLEQDGVDDPGSVIEFDAIEQLHRLSAGVPDRVHDLCVTSLQLAERDSAWPISVDVVDQAERAPLASTSPPPAPSAAGNAAAPMTALGRLVVHLEGEPAWVHRIDGDSLSIGRDGANGMQIASGLVSRNHAVLMRTPAGVKLMDLGSTNGTYVNGRKISSCLLKSGDRIVVGDCRIEYLLGPGRADPVAASDAAHTEPVSRASGTPSPHRAPADDNPRPAGARRAEDRPPSPDPRQVAAVRRSP